MRLIGMRKLAAKLPYQGRGATHRGQHREDAEAATIRPKILAADSRHVAVDEINGLIIDIDGHGTFARRR